MKSEGTDIPRLQVCCHLSGVKRELYVRQVLGRILRINDSPNQEAWLFTLAEEKLSILTNRIVQELLDLCVLVKSNAVANDFSVAGNNKKVAPTSTGIAHTQIIALLGEPSLSEQLNGPKHQKENLSEPA